MNKNTSTVKAENKPTHTPGPWFIFPDQPQDVYAKDGNDGSLIMTARAHGRAGRHILVGAEHEANARLIAAAPDLLAALSHWFDCLPFGDIGKRVFPTSSVHAADLNAAMDAARAAIEKAEGR